MDNTTHINAIRVEYLFEFKSKQQWIDKGQSWFKPYTSNSEKTICLDTCGNVLTCGKDFADAEIISTYPVKVYRLIRVSEVVQAMVEDLKDGKKVYPESEPEEAKDNPTSIHSFIIEDTHDHQTGEDGYRIVGLYGDVRTYEGFRFGPKFKENELDKCEKLVDELEAKFTLPVKISDIISHFSGISIGTKLKTTDGDGVVEDIKPGAFPYLIRLENDGLAWIGLSHITSMIP